jgi:hypothetical protein
LSKQFDNLMTVPQGFRATDFACQLANLPAYSLLNLFEEACYNTIQYDDNPWEVFMTTTATDSIRKVTDLAKELPESSLKELINFAEYLRTKEKKFSYGQVTDSANYIRELRAEEGKKVKSGRAFIKALIEWQESNS